MKAIWNHKGIAMAVVVLAGAGVFYLFSYAGVIEPTEYPGPTMHTLDEIYGVAGSQVGPVYAAEDRSVAAMQIDVDGPTGILVGPWDEPGYVGWIKLLDVSYNFTNAYDPCTWNPNAVGVWQPGAITVVKEIDNTSPSLLQLCCAGDRMDVNIDFFRKNPTTGAKEAYLKIKLYIVKISKYGEKLVHRGDGQYAHCEELSFMWTRMDMMWVGPPSVLKTVDWTVH
jgi:type VI secretion system Hcp family effector